MTPARILNQCYVFPLSATTLKPLIKWRKGSLKGVASFPNHSGPWGIDCGKSGLVVVDVDVKNGKDGRKSLANLPPLPETYTVKTKSGGYHYYYRGNSRNTASVLGEGLDTRSEGGFVVLYEEVVCAAPIAELPEPLREKLGGTPVKADREERALIDLDQPCNISAAVDYARRADPAIEGAGGDAHTLKIAMRLKDMGVSEETALEILLAEWNDRCSPPWDADELERKVANAYTYGRAAPGSQTREHSLLVSEMAAEDVFAGTVAAVKETRTHAALKIIPAPQWSSTTPPPSDPVLTGFFDIGDIAAVIGAAKSYKTWFLLQLAACIASARPFLGIEIKKPRKVLFIQFEVTANHFHRRFKTLLHGLGLTEPLDNLGFINGRGLDVQMSQISEAVRAWGAEVIFLDPLYMLIEGEENSATDLKFLLKQFSAIANDAGAAILFSHHDSKGFAGDRKTVDRGSGSSVLGRFYDGALIISDHRDLDDYKVITPILRNYKPVAPFCVTWDKVFTLSDLPADILTSRSNNQRATSRIAAANYIKEVRQCIANAPACAVNQAALIESLRTSAGLTKAHAHKAIKAALESPDESLRIFSNGGHGLQRKQNLYAISARNLEKRISQLNKNEK
jgi:hypothetical protein